MLEWRLIPHFVINAFQKAYILWNVGEYLVSPIGCVVTAQGSRGITARVDGNDVLIGIDHANLADDAFVVFTAQRDAESVSTVMDVVLLS